jgi:PD-(D/E)XK nuclease superfamily
MMRIVYFSKKNQLWDELNSFSEAKLFITPSPLKADNLRSELPPGLNGDVVTIAKFTSDLLMTLWDEESRPTVKRKSELLVIFGILKNKFLPNLGYEQFIQAYNLFSELRSFTLNQDALSSVIEEEAPEIQEALKIFWQLLDATGFSDEHGAYQKISEGLRSHEEEESLKKVFIFWGFQHLNGQQVDLLKALAIRYQVVIPFPSALKEKLRRSDWVSWMKDDKVLETDLPQIAIAPKLDWIPINSRELSLNLKTLLKGPSEVILGVSKLKAAHFDYLPSDEVSFKIPHQILEAEIFEIANELDQEIDQFKDFEEWCAAKKASIVEGLKVTYAFKKLRAFQLYEESYKALRELTDEVVKMDVFFRKLLKDVSLLNQPRTSFIPLLQEKGQIYLRDMSSLESIDYHREIFLCVDEVFEDIQGLGLNYRDSIAKELSALGPLKRNDLDLQFRQWELENLLSDAHVTLLMPPGVLKHNLVWKRIFQNVEMNIKDFGASGVAKKIKSHLMDVPKKPYLGNFSASRLQAYLDCPQKFYFSYVEKINPDLKLEKDIDPRISGTLIHKIIEDREKGDVKSLSKKVLDEYILENNLLLPKDVYERRLLIITQRAQNGLNFLDQVKALVPDVTWNIEKDFKDDEDYKIAGKIDCLGISQNFIFLLDFKSTAASASTNKEILSRESLQLWVYTLAAKKIVPDFDKKTIIMGYVVLDDPTESNLLVQDEELFKLIKENKFARPALIKESMSELLTEAQTHLKEIVQKVREEKVFEAQPRKAIHCSFCDMRFICTKGSLSV